MNREQKWLPEGYRVVAGKPEPVEWLQPLENGLTVAVGLLKFLLEAISALCVALGLVSTLRLAASRRPHELGFSALRLRFGSWLALALEFQLGADIVGTTVAPSFEALAKLATLAVVRTFLNYFLQRELEAGRREADTPVDSPEA